MKQKKNKKKETKKKKKRKKNEREKERKKGEKEGAQSSGPKEENAGKHLFYRAGMDAAVMDAVHSWEVAAEPMGAVPRPDARGTKRKRAEAPPAGAKRPRW